CQYSHVPTLARAVMPVNPSTAALNTTANVPLNRRMRTSRYERWARFLASLQVRISLISFEVLLLFVPHDGLSTPMTRIAVYPSRVPAVLFPSMCRPVFNLP